MYKLQLRPDNSAYSVSDGKDIVATKLDGGAARYRKDISGATSLVNVTFICDPVEYKYLRAFYRAITSKGAIPFLIDLILDDSELTEHKVYFIPESFQLTSQQGLTYSVSAQLEVYPLEVTEEDGILASLFSEFGPYWESLFPVIENELNSVTTTSLINNTILNYDTELI